MKWEGFLRGLITRRAGLREPEPSRLAPRYKAASYASLADRFSDLNRPRPLPSSRPATSSRKPKTRGTHRTQLGPGTLRRALQPSSTEAWSQFLTLPALTEPRASASSAHLAPGYRSETMHNLVHILSTPTAETTGVSLVVHFDHRRYLFGSIGQGTQRAYVQRSHSTSKLEKLFVSGPVGWGSMGGLMGMLLTVADSFHATKKEQEAKNEERKSRGKPGLDIFSKGLDVVGGQNLTYAVATSRNFIFRTGVPINVSEFDQDPRRGSGPHDFSKPDWADDTLRVWQIPVAPAAAAAAAAENGTAPSRKRTFDMMAEPGDEAADSAPGRDPVPSSDEGASQASTTKKICRGVTDAMFNSDWAMDRLFETRLGDVQLPAKLWVRGANGLEPYQGKLPSEDPSVADVKVLARAPWPSIATTELPPTRPVLTSVSYVAKNGGRRGKFDPKAAKALGVDVRDFKKLTSGESVPGKDGTTVTPDMVLGDSVAGTGFALLEVPTLDHVQGLLDRPEWEAADLMDGVHVFYWSLGRGVFDDARLQAFMNARPSVKHVIMAPDVSPNMITFESLATLQTKLGRVDPDRYPILDFNNRSGDVSAAVPSAVVGRTGMVAKLLPNYEFVESDAVPFAKLDDAKNLERGVVALAKEAADKVKQPEFVEMVEQDEKDIPDRDTVIIPLGTGSSIPAKYRNVSSTLIRVPGAGSYLLDCGEGTEGQIRRALGDAEFDKVMLDLKVIFISHMHADHHLGTAGVLTQWHRLTREAGRPDARLTVCGPDAMRTWLREYAQVEDIGHDRLVVLDSRDVMQGKHRNPQDLAAAGLSNLQTVSVRHCHEAYAGVLTWPSGLKIAYSGDCRPSPAFAKTAAGATLLIHECTFGDDKAADAKAKKHSTMGEALSIAVQMRARRVLLTHFSQRYSKVNLVEPAKVAAEEGGEAKEQIVLFAWDQMQVKLGQFRHAAAFVPAVTALLEKEDGS